MATQRRRRGAGRATTKAAASMAGDPWPRAAWWSGAFGSLHLRAAELSAPVLGQVTLQAGLGQSLTPTRPRSEARACVEHVLLVIRAVVIIRQRRQVVLVLESGRVHGVTILEQSVHLQFSLPSLSFSLPSISLIATDPHRSLVLRLRAGPPTPPMHALGVLSPMTLPAAPPNEHVRRPAWAGSLCHGSWPKTRRTRSSGSWLSSHSTSPTQSTSTTFPSGR